MVDIASDELEDPVSEKMCSSIPLRGHAGGIKGGQTKAAILTAEQRRGIAKNAAESRWKKG